MKRIIFTLLILRFGLALPSSGTLDFLNQWQVENQVTSVVIIIDDLANNNITSYTSGTITREQKSPVRTNNLYGIASISKTFVAAALLKLQEEGKLNLDQCIGKYFPEYPRWKNITIRELLNMTSGIYNYSQSAQYRKLSNTKDIVSPNLLIDMAYQKKDHFPEGQGWEYSNTNYLMAGLIIEKVTGKSIIEVYQDDFFTPLTLQKTYYSNGFYPKEVTEKMAHGYVNDKDVTAFNASLLSSEGGMLMNSQDLLTWTKSLFLNRAILSQESLAQLQSTIVVPNMSPRPKDSRYGLGVFYTVLPTGEVLWWYTGVIDGYTSFFGFIPEKNKIIVVQAASWPEGNYSILFPNKALIHYLLGL